MNFKPDRTAWKAGQLSYNDHIKNPSERREDLYCLTLAQSEALIAVIDHYRYLTRWIDDSDEPLSLNSTMQFIDDTQRRLMMPCGDDNAIILSQWTPDGHYQESTDGGETYHDAPAKDPRNNVPLPPPFLPPDTLDDKCTYADSIVNNLIDKWIGETGATEDEATVVEGIISFLAGIFGAFGVVAAAITLGIAIVIVAFTVAAWKAAFVSDVWDRLRCNLKDHIGDDGAWDQAGVDAVYDQIATDETGIVRISLQGMIAALGVQGLTIAARNGRGSPSAECCVSDCKDNFAVNSSVGTEVGRAFDYIDVESVFYAPYGFQTASLKTADQDTCCFVSSYEVLTEGVSILDVHRIFCGTTDEITGGIFTSGCVWLVTFILSGVGTVRVHFDDCP